MNEEPFNPNLVSRFPVLCAAFIGNYIDIEAVDGRVTVIRSDNSNVVDPLSPPSAWIIKHVQRTIIQDWLNSAALDQDAFVAIGSKSAGIVSTPRAVTFDTMIR